MERKVSTHPTDEILVGLGFAGPEPRNLDSLDFRDLPVWLVRSALREAYLEGVKAGMEIELKRKKLK